MDLNEVQSLSVSVCYFSDHKIKGNDQSVDELEICRYYAKHLFFNKGVGFSSNLKWYTTIKSYLATINLSLCFQIEHVLKLLGFDSEYPTKIGQSILVNTFNRKSLFLLSAQDELASCHHSWFSARLSDKLHVYCVKLSSLGKEKRFLKRKYAVHFYSGHKLKCHCFFFIFFPSIL